MNPIARWIEWIVFSSLWLVCRSCSSDRRHSSLPCSSNSREARRIRATRQAASSTETTRPARSRRSPLTGPSGRDRHLFKLREASWRRYQLRGTPELAARSGPHSIRRPQAELLGSSSAIAAVMSWSFCRHRSGTLRQRELGWVVAILPHLRGRPCCSLGLRGSRQRARAASVEAVKAPVTNHSPSMAYGNARAGKPMPACDFGHVRPREIAFGRQT